MKTIEEMLDYVKLILSEHRSGELIDEQARYKIETALDEWYKNNPKEPEAPVNEQGAEPEMYATLLKDGDAKIIFGPFDSIEEADEIEGRNGFVPDGIYRLTKVEPNKT